MTLGHTKHQMPSLRYLLKVYQLFVQRLISKCCIPESKQMNLLALLHAQLNVKSAQSNLIKYFLFLSQMLRQKHQIQPHQNPTKFLQIHHLDDLEAHCQRPCTAKIQCSYTLQQEGKENGGNLCNQYLQTNICLSPMVYLKQGKLPFSSKRIPIIAIELVATNHFINSLNIRCVTLSLIIDGKDTIIVNGVTFLDQPCLHHAYPF